MSLALVRQALLFGLIGLVLGVAQLLSLRTVVRRYVAERSGARAIGLHVGRTAAIVVLWVIVGRLGGALGVLAAFVGFLLARPLVMARLRKGAP